MRSTLAAAGLLALGFAPLFAEEKAPPAPSPSVDALVEQLANPSFRVREAAAKALEDRGESSLAELRKAFAGSSNAETRRRLQGLISNMERTLALAPKRVTLKVKDQPVMEVIAALSKQTGYRIQYNANQGLRLTLNLENVTFWEAMDRICVDSGLMLQHNEGQQIMLYQQDQVWPYVNYQGPFKVMANSFHYNRNITLGGLQRNQANNVNRSDSLSFTFNIQSEPKLPIMQVSQAKLTEVYDENGRSMKVPNSDVHQSQYFHHGYRTYNQSSSVQLAWPNKETKAVKLLKGTIPVTVLAFQKPEIVVEDVLKVKNKKFAGPNVELQIDEVKENNKTSYQVKMAVRNLAPNAAQDYSWTNSVHQRIELYDAKGNRLFPQGYNWENSTPANVQATFMFGTNGDATIGAPARLVYNHWGMIQTQVDFEFRDLPLP
ncbi:MAG: HEAT repeat domain-containing protein [Gemmataceae bacterium]